MWERLQSGTSLGQLCLWREEGWGSLLEVGEFDPMTAKTASATGY
jgi:hypothetical protein